MCYSFIVASISIIVHSKRLPWFRFFLSPMFPIGIDVDAKTRTQVWKSSSRRIVPPLQLTDIDVTQTGLPLPVVFFQCQSYFLLNLVLSLHFRLMYLFGGLDTECQFLDLKHPTYYLVP